MNDTLRELHRKFWKELPKPELTSESQQQKERSEETLTVLCVIEEDEDEN